MNREFESVILGSWKQGAEGTIQPIHWQVLKTEENRMLVLTEHILDMQPFHSESQSVRWENSSLRRWLQQVFLPDAFTETEQNRIFRNPESEDPAGDFLWQMFGMETATSTISDPVFLLSTADMVQYFPSENTLLCPGASAEASEYVKEQYPEVRTDNAIWWLRSSMSQMPMAYIVSPCDSVGVSAVYSENLQGIRPAMWLKR